MSAKFFIASLAIGGSLSLSAQGAADLSAFLSSLPEYSADARFEVLLPQAYDPVVYDIALESHATPGDSLSPCDYVISWQSDSPSGPTSGFAAYYDGNHYRYRNHRLQEYHTAASMLPFMPQGAGSSRQGVQATAQFVDLLPQTLAHRISEIAADTSYIYAFHPDTLIQGRHCIAIDGAKRGNGYDVALFSYIFDKDTMLPVASEITSSPGSISEQTVNVYYTTKSDTPSPVSEESLAARWPDVFEKYRESTFRAENLVGAPLPAFSCQVHGSPDRYSHHTDEVLAHPTVFVFIDPEVTTSEATISGIREAVAMAPVEVDLVWVLAGNDAEAVTTLIGDRRPGETTLTSARSLVRDCGITLYPTTIIADSSAKVRDVTPGYNKDISTIVLQKIMLVD